MLNAQHAVLQRIANLFKIWWVLKVLLSLFYTRRSQKQQEENFQKLLNDCETEVIFKRELDTQELKSTLHVLQSHLKMKYALNSLTARSSKPQKHLRSITMGNDFQA